ncbi:MAG: NAD(P)-dependent oxidoreductase, partial [bacterium]
MYKNKRIKLGFIGIGLMGRPMVIRLLMADYEVFAWNRSPEKLKEVVSAGAVPCESACEVAANANIVLLCLADGDAVTHVVTDKPFLDALSPDKILVDLSSIPPDTTLRTSELIEKSTGAKWIDAPVSGGVPGAEQGTLVIMAGGEELAIETVKPVLA